jgi:hypothetical protein
MNRLDNLTDKLNKIFLEDKKKRDLLLKNK